ncbi:hypothetical protein OHA57_39355 (plasmid) [Streptomyces anulatus]|nr:MULTISPECIES: hypothetical protein [Streptomyces]WSC66962.1 hypothetical protein OHA57_39355 [Streptomyces anulatus]
MCRALAVPRPRHATELRRRLLMLSVRIHWHPFWSTPAGWTPAAWVALRRQTCGHRSEGVLNPAARRPWAG